MPSQPNTHCWEEFDELTATTFPDRFNNVHFSQSSKRQQSAHITSRYIQTRVGTFTKQVNESNTIYMLKRKKKILTPKGKRTKLHWFLMTLEGLAHLVWITTTINGSKIKPEEMSACMMMARDDKSQRSHDILHVFLHLGVEVGDDRCVIEGWEDDLSILVPVGKAQRSGERVLRTVAMQGHIWRSFTWKLSDHYSLKQWVNGDTVSTILEHECFPDTYHTSTQLNSRLTYVLFFLYQH